MSCAQGSSEHPTQLADPELLAPRSCELRCRKLGVWIVADTGSASWPSSEASEELAARGVAAPEQKSQHYHHHQLAEHTLTAATRTQLALVRGGGRSPALA